MGKTKKRNWLVLALLFAFSAISMAFGVGLTTKGVILHADGPTSEQAMQSFLQKIEGNNYVMDHHYISSGEDYYDQTVVCSQDLVYVTDTMKFNFGDPDHLYDGYAIMTINNNETFVGYFYENTIENVEFVSIKKANEFIAAKTLLNWLDVDNIWEVFYGGIFPGEPYKYFAQGETNFAVQALKQYANYSGGAFGGGDLAKVYLDLTYNDAGDEIIKAEFTGYDSDDNFLQNTRVVVTFGNAQADARATAWMQNPNIDNLEVRTEWGGYITNLNSLFLKGYEEMAFPFPTFATYALYIDIENVLAKGEFVVQDSRATEQALQEYTQKLLANDFKKYVEDGKTYYRRLLRPENNCYSQLEIEYNNGVKIVATKYFEYPTYNSLLKVNQRLQECGYPQLDNLANGLAFVDAKDTACSALESWLGFFDYETVLKVDIAFDNIEDVESYLQQYINANFADYAEINTSDEDEEDGQYDELEAYLNEKVDRTYFESVAGDSKYWKLVTRDGVRTFRYHDNRDDDPNNKTVTLLYKYEKYLSNIEINNNLEKFGFPAINNDVVSKITSARSLKLYHEYLNGREYQLSMNLSFNFDSAQQATAALDAYFNNLMENEGYESVYQNLIGMSRGAVFYKSSEGKLWIVGVDYEDNSDQALIEFRVDDLPKRIWWEKADALEDVDIKEVFDSATAVGRGVELNIKKSKVTFNSVAAKKIAENQEVLFSFQISEDVENENIVGAAKVLTLSITGFSEGKATIEIPINEDDLAGKIAKIYFVDDNGEVVDMQATTKDGVVVFETSHFSKYVIAYEDVHNLSNLAIICIIAGSVSALFCVAFCIYFAMLRKKRFINR